MTVFKAIAGYSPEASQFIVFRYILTTIVLIRNTFLSGTKQKNPLLMQSTHQEGDFFGKNGTPAFRLIFSFVSN